MKRLIGLVLMAVSIFIGQEAFAQDCRILAVEKTSEQGDWQIRMSLKDLPINSQFFFKGQKYPNGPWIYYLSTQDGNDVGITKLKWPSGEFIEFSYGVRIGEKEFWTDPTCSGFEYDGHFRLQLGEKVKTRVPIEAITLLLLSPDEPVIHKCPVVGVKRILTEGDLGDYEITLSLQKFLGAPLEAVPYIDRQEAPDSAWTGFYPISRKEDVAIEVIKKWPIGSPIEFSYKLVHGEENFWQDLASWDTECLQVYNDHFRVILE
ncbi:MAG: hypothetical protein RBS77_01415 [Candidatus Moranbacteria bacterium]|jgi:hypothetical protein|nr:hypothetical protein [Candidatus Moranbacteria bacterium]